MTEIVDDIDPSGELDGLDGYIPPPYRAPLTLDERLVKAWRAITLTPGRAALAAADLCAIAGFAISLRTIPVTTVDEGGPLRARCGISFYVARASNRAVDTACRYAFASRMPELVLFGLTALGLTAALIWTIVRRPDERGGLGWLWRQVTRTPGRAALAMFDLAALVAVLGASQPVSIVAVDAGGPLRAHCGLQYYVFRVGNSVVSHACRKAYGPRASFFLVALTVLVIGVIALVKVARSDTLT